MARNLYLRERIRTVMRKGRSFYIDAWRHAKRNPEKLKEFITAVENDLQDYPDHSYAKPLRKLCDATDGKVSVNMFGLPNVFSGF